MKKIWFILFIGVVCYTTKCKNTTNLELHNKQPIVQDFVNQIRLSYTDSINFRLLTNDSVKYWNQLCFFEQKYIVRESGVAFYIDSNYIEWCTNYENKRIIDEPPDDIICKRPYKFKLKNDTITITTCVIYTLKIIKLTDDTLILKLNNNNNPMNLDTIVCVKSRDQITKPVFGELLSPDTSTWPVKVIFKE